MTENPTQEAAATTAAATATNNARATTSSNNAAEDRAKNNHNNSGDDTKNENVKMKSLSSPPQTPLVVDADNSMMKDGKPTKEQQQQQKEEVVAKEEEPRDLAKIKEENNEVETTTMIASSNAASPSNMNSRKHVDDNEKDDGTEKALDNNDNDSNNKAKEAAMTPSFPQSTTTTTTATEITPIVKERNHTTDSFNGDNGGISNNPPSKHQSSGDAKSIPKKGPTPSTTSSTPPSHIATGGGNLRTIWPTMAPYEQRAFKWRHEPHDVLKKLEVSDMICMLKTDVVGKTPGYYRKLIRRRFFPNEVKAFVDGGGGTSSDINSKKPPPEGTNNAAGLSTTEEKPSSSKIANNSVADEPKKNGGHQQKGGLAAINDDAVPPTGQKQGGQYQKGGLTAIHGNKVRSNGQKDEFSNKMELNESAAVQNPPQASRTDGGMKKPTPPPSTPPPPPEAAMNSVPAREIKQPPKSNYPVSASKTMKQGVAEKGGQQQRISANVNPSLTTSRVGGTQNPGTYYVKQQPKLVVKKPVFKTIQEKQQERENRNKVIAMNLPLSSTATDIKGITQRPSGKWQCQLYCAGQSRYIGVFESETMAVMAYRVVRAKIKAVAGNNWDETKTKQMSLLENLRKRYISQNKDDGAEAILQQDYEEYVIGNPSAVESPPSVTANQYENKSRSNQKHQHPHQQTTKKAVMEQGGNSSKAASNNKSTANGAGNSRSTNSNNKTASKINAQNDDTKKKRKSSLIDANRGNNKSNPTKKQKSEAKLWDSIRPGDRIAIFWPDDDQYYDATVQKQRSKDSSEFFLLYDDEETEWLDLNKEKFHFLMPPPPAGGGESSSNTTNNKKSNGVKTANNNTKQQPPKVKDPSVVSFCQHYATSRSQYNDTDENLWTLLHAGDRISIFREDKKAYVPALVVKQRGKDSPIFFLVYNYDDHLDKELCGGAECCSWADMRYEDYTITRQQNSYERNDLIPSKIRFQFNFSEKVYQLLVDFELEDPTIGHWKGEGTSFVMDETHPKMGEYLSRYFKHSSFSSFRRQLNTYGFTKKRFGDLARNYMHSSFRKENTPVDIANMNQSKKKKSSTSETSVVSPAGEESAWAGAIGITVGGSRKRLFGGSLDVEPYYYGLEQQQHRMNKQNERDRKRRHRREKELSTLPAVGYDLGNDYLSPIMQSPPFLQNQSFFYHDDDDDDAGRGDDDEKKGDDKKTSSLPHCAHYLPPIIQPSLLH